MSAKAKQGSDALLRDKQQWLAEGQTFTCRKEIKSVLIVTIVIKLVFYKFCPIFPLIDVDERGRAVKL